MNPLKKHLIALLLLLFLSTIAHSLDEKTLLAYLQQTPTQQGQFTQTRELKDLPYPLKSQGYYQLENNTLHRHITTPIDIQNKIDQHGIWQHNGQTWIASDNISEKTQIELFLALFQGDSKTLKQQFDLKLTGDTENWQLTLTPKSTLLQQIFQQIQLQGDKNIRQIIIEERQGDRLHIELTPTTQPTEKHSKAHN